MLRLGPLAPARAGSGPFQHGVASGDPLADRVIIWTRVTVDAPDPVPVRWIVARDPDLRDVVASGEAVTGAESDHTVNVDATGLEPATTYWYRFELPVGSASPVGRTRTAPAGRVERVRFAAVSCSSFAAGFFNPYARLAERDDLDAVVHVGDYFYEGGGADVRPVEPPRETVTLADYRARFAWYRRDADLQAVHARHPFIAVWDDHESANNSWVDGAGNHQPHTEGEWATRRLAAVQAYREWMPIRWPDPADPVRIWRHLPFGDLVDLFMVDTRLWGRAQPETPTGTFEIGSNDPNRTMLGAGQLDWLQAGLASSADRGVAWRVLGNQTMISPHRNDPTQPPLPYLPPEAVEVLGIRQGGGNEGADNWGAYWRERDQLLGFLRDRAIIDNVVLTGDIHSAWACDVTEDAYNPASYDRLTGRGSVAAEFVCTSVTSHNFEESAADQAPLLNLLLETLNPNVIHHDLAGHGYTLVELTPAAARAEYWETGTARRRSAEHTLAASLVSHRGTDHVVRAGVPALPRPDRLLGGLVPAGPLF